MSESGDGVDCSVVVARCRPDVEGGSAYKVNFSAKIFVMRAVQI